MLVLESLFNEVAGIQRAISSKKPTPVEIFYYEFCKIVNCLLNISFDDCF